MGEEGDSGASAEGAGGEATGRTMVDWTMTEEDLVRLEGWI